MAIRDTILTLKNKEGTLTNNKVCNFAYDDTAYADDTTAGANGVVNYNYNNHNNIPVKDNAVIKVNPTITSKGFRSQVSTLPRMLLNHIFGRVSYNLNKTVDTFNATLQALYGAIGQANGLASLDNTGRLPYSQLPLSAVEYKGAWNADTNTPALSSGRGTFGDEYIVSVQGTQNLGEGSVTYGVGDRVIYNGSIWQRIPSSSVRSVNTKTPDANGNVTVNAGDIVTPDVYGYDKTQMGTYWNTSSGMSERLTSLASSEDIIVAGGYFGGIFWSEDYGEHWTAISSTFFSTVRKIKYLNGMWFALGRALNNTGIFWSLDGKVWQAGTGTFTQADDIDYDGTRFVAVCAETTSVHTSTDGKTWTSSAFNFSATNVDGDTAEIKYANGVWAIAISSNTLGYQGGFLISTDNGVNWTEQSSFTELNLYFAGILYIPEQSLWLIYGRKFSNSLSNNRGKCFISNNGVAWQVLSSYPLSASSVLDIGSIMYAENEFIFSLAVTESSATKYCIYKTADLADWTLLNENSEALFSSLLYSKRFKRYIAGTVGNHNVISSSDLTNWQEGNAKVVHFVETKYSIVGGAGGQSSMRYTKGTPTNNVKTILDWLIYAVDNMLD